MALKNGTTLADGKYKIVRFISSGGFGCTYEGVHDLMGVRVAIKEFFPSDFCNRDENTGKVSIGTLSKTEFVNKLKERFIREATVLFSLQHPNIVHVTDVFEENGTAYYVMDYVDGRSLGDIQKEAGRLPEQEAVNYISQVCDALKYVHDKGHLHLDIKPDNIMVDHDGKVVIIDFGTSKQYTEQGGVTSTTFGLTPGFAPPEQCSGDSSQYNAASDIYAVGSTLYRLLTGKTPVDALKRASGAQLDPLPADVSPNVQHAVFKSMSLLRNARPQSTTEFMEIIKNGAPDCDYSATVSGGGGGGGTTKVVTNKAQQWEPQGQVPENVQKNSTVKIIIIAVAIVLVIVIGVLIALILNKNDDKETGAVEDTTAVVSTDAASATTPDSTPTTTTEAPAAEAAPEPAEEVQRSLEGNYSLSGSVGKYGVVMQLDISGDYVSGKYRYSRMKGAGGWLTVSGNRSGGDSSGEIYISEYNDMGENCGNWSGTYSLNGNKLSISGSMMNYKGDTYSFHLSGK